MGNVEPADISAVDIDIYAHTLPARSRTGSPAERNVTTGRRHIQVDRCPVCGSVQIGCPVTITRCVMHGRVAGVVVTVGRVDDGVVRPLARKWHADDDLSSLGSLGANQQRQQRTHNCNGTAEESSSRRMDIQQNNLFG